jgi:hypothetical protein
LKDITAQKWFGIILAQDWPKVQEWGGITLHDAIMSLTVSDIIATTT